MLKGSSRSRNFFRKLVVNGVNSSKTAIQNDCLMRLYDADSELKAISSELDSFDGKKDPVRCNLLVNQLRTAQDKVISLLFQLMDDCNCERASRDYRMKFPDEILLSEGSESLNGQIWFGAECLSAGSNILNHNKESTMLRPMAKTLTQHLDSLRNDLRDLVIDGGGASRINDTLIKKMVAFDHIFATFEYEYVRTMLPIRTVAEIEKLQEVSVLFSETLIDCLKRGLIKQDDIEEFQPIVMIAIPRLAIVRGLLYKNENPIYTRHKSQMCSLFQPFHGPLHSIRKLLRGLRSHELYTLERMLANDQSNNSENDQTAGGKASNDVVETNESKSEHHQEDGQEESSSHQAGTSGGNYANVLMDGLQYPVGQKRLSVDEEVESRDQEYNCYLEVQASSSKSNVDACGSPVDKESSVPSPSTSISSSSHHHQSSHRMKAPQPTGEENDSHDRQQTNKTECDNEHCCLSPPESDAQLEKLIANFSPSMNDESSESSPGQQQQQPQQQSEPQCDQAVAQTSEGTQSQSDGSTTNVKSSRSKHRHQQQPNTKSENEAELDELFQKQAQQLLHRLFVAISGVADQLQSNFASDLRFILRHIFSSELAADDSDDGELELEDELNNGLDEVYEDDDEDEEGEYSNEHSDSSLPIEQGIEARETNLIDFDSGYPFPDPYERDMRGGASLQPSDPSIDPNTASEIPFVSNPTTASIEQQQQQQQHYLPPPPPPPSVHMAPPPPPPSSSSLDYIDTAAASSASQEEHASHYTHQAQADEPQRFYLDQRRTQELLADLMRQSGHQQAQNSIHQQQHPHSHHHQNSHQVQESPNEPSILESSQHHQRLMQQHLQSVSRATNRIAAAAAAASSATLPGYGHSIVSDGNSNGGGGGGYPQTVSSGHRSERRSRHHGGSRSRRLRGGPPVWVPDQDVIQCSCCNAPFTLFRRRHHCRACGHIFCADCSKFTKNLNCWGYNGPVRVCESCYHQL